jgi:hypothetical protein
MPRPSSPTKPNDGTGHDIVDEQVIAGNGGKGNEDAPAKDGSKKNVFEIPSVKKHDELALRFDGLGGNLRNQPGSEEIRGNSDRLKIQIGGPEGEDSQASSGRAGENELRTLTPSATVLDRIVAGAPANDLTPLDDVELGNGTYLNTREWKYSSFFNRIKQYVGMHWDPNTVVRTRDPTGEIFLYKDRYTVVAVTLDHRAAQEHQRGQVLRGGVPRRRGDAGLPPRAALPQPPAGPAERPRRDPLHLRVLPGGRQERAAAVQAGALTLPAHLAAQSAFASSSSKPMSGTR